MRTGSHQQKTFEPEPGRRTLLVRTAAKMVGIAPELLAGLVQSKHFDGTCVAGRSGQPIWVIYGDQMPKLREMTGTVK